MTDQHSTFQLLARELARILEPIVTLELHTNPIDSLIELIRDAGWEIEETLTEEQPLFELLESLSSIGQFVQEWSSGNGNITSNPVSALRRFAEGFSAIRKLNNSIGDLGTHLVEYLIVRYLRIYRIASYNWLRFIGIIREENDEEGRVRLNVGDFPNFLRSPAGHIGSLYGWGSDFKGAALVENILPLIWQFELLSRLEYISNDDRVLLGIAHDSEELIAEIRMPFATAKGKEGIIELGVRFIPISGSASTGHGIGLVPFGASEFSQSTELGGGWNLNFHSSIDASQAHVVFLKPGGYDLVGNDELSGLSKLQFNLRLIKQSINNTVIFSTEDGISLKVGGVGFNVDAEYGQTENLTLLLDFSDVQFFLSGGNGDGFLQKIIPADGFMSSFNFSLGWSATDGIVFGGSGGLDIDLPLHLKIGPLGLETIHLGAYLTIEGTPHLESTVTLDVNVLLGPLSVFIKEIGARIPVKFEAGNAGPLDIGLEFHHPTGAGLSINASGITGAGILDIDQTNNRYFGFVGLNFGEIGMAAYGLISTKMPDGSNGFAMLIGITAIFDPPISLSFGFTLSGVGGLIGINRTIAIDALRAGIKNRTIDSILFPDPATVVTNASKMISDLRAVFPPEDGRFVVGPVVRIGWGTPNIITGDLGLFLELPSPIRIVLLGQINALLPEKNTALLVIHLDILGVLDFEKKELSFQASLFDSRILTYGLLGDAAFLLGWGDDPRFALSVGGFHPRFPSPAPATVFADLRRLTLSISKDSSFQLTGTAYFALTPNSLQFGRRVELYVKKSGFVIRGHLGFDAIFRLNPFSFEVDIEAGVKLKYKRFTGLEINLSFTLSGPRPWLAKGKAKIKVCWVKIKIKFSISWGSDVQEVLVAIDPWPLLQEAFKNPKNWGSIVPPRYHRG